MSTLSDISNRVSVARGDSPADLLFRNCRIINTFNAQIEEADIAVCGHRIAGVGEYHKGKEILEISGGFVCPGFIDGHIHLESTLLNPVEYAKIVVPRGVLGVVTDFHEIANVCGKQGIEYIINCGASIPMDIFGMAPSCVPATGFESSGAQIDIDDLRELMSNPGIIGLGEMMNYPGIVSGDHSVLEKIDLFHNRHIDGHAPGLSGKSLNAYISTGIRSEHECTTLEEAEEKLRRGMYIMIREGSSEKNLEALLPLVTDQTFKRCLFVVDDRHCADLMQDGDVDGVVRQAIKLGLDPVRAIQMATINTAECFGFNCIGAIAPGYKACFFVFDNLKDIRPRMVFYNGRLVAEKGKIALSVPDQEKSPLGNSIHIRPFKVDDLLLHGEGINFPVIKIIPDQIITKKSDENVKTSDGVIVPDIERDLLKIAVFERHKATGHIGIGLIRGFGLKKGAIASSIAHDSHNVISIGVNDNDISMAVKELERIHGGYAIASENRILGSLPLPIAGLLSEDPLERVVKKYKELEQIIIELGCRLRDPFAALSFLALPVIPEIRLTDIGIFDVTNFRIINTAKSCTKNFNTLKI